MLHPMLGLTVKPEGRALSARAASSAVLRSSPRPATAVAAAAAATAAAAAAAAAAAVVSVQ